MNRFPFKWRNVSIHDSRSLHMCDVRCIDPQLDDVCCERTNLYDLFLLLCPEIYHQKYGALLGGDSLKLSPKVSILPSKIPTTWFPSSTAWEESYHAHRAVITGRKHSPNIQSNLSSKAIRYPNGLLWSARKCVSTKPSISQKDFLGDMLLLELLLLV
jgi:hypothetical protein